MMSLFKWLRSVEKFQLFIGDDNRKAPVFNVPRLMSGMMETVGKVMAHVLFQQGLV